MQALHFRDDLGPQSSPGPLPIRVRRVIDRRHAQIVQVGGERPPAEGQQRANDLSPTLGDTGQPPQVSSSHQPEQHGFGLVVGMVADGQAVCPGLRDHTFQPPIPGVPQAGLLDLRRHRRSAQVEWQSEVCGQCTRLPGILIGAGLHLVIEVRRFQAQAKVGSKMG
jgi:hypothetical protein